MSLAKEFCSVSWPWGSPRSSGCLVCISAFLEHMKINTLSAVFLRLALFTAAYAQTLGKAKLDQFFDRLTGEREQWQAMNSTLQGIWRALSIPGPANHAAPAAPLPKEA